MLENLTVFLIDDDIEDQEIFSIMLEDALPDAKCVFAKDGIQALEKLEQPAFSPDVIFIDINMPRMNGMEFLAEMKKRPSLIHIPAVMYSTSDEKAIVQQCKALGASGLIKKHANTDEVKEEIKRIVTTLF
ncbi:response regulator [Dyadobacter chenhuakuii]|uniref:Response regulator n=1 Tax=Dyadobacter chenhuakuii TaxID=2909339 RepID=A0ABY4XQ15_9BACT|nr:response regulator [Dyadobacter chenhuakuii]MCF2493186.1 response regulator [Dyadobacter chenhuakuii]USJ32530.1 response regulator [Dyadobacter chenhuakuii]